ncbi:uncharacterized protein LOC131583280 [Poecile atricapillus]|uniref:uncharacterized protein LOC131583280 n=1 Tax=Poecile atricapillus TaxID=48891 RepID=UPI002738B32F|nr:uncharacterized protein LOC131583280 [Poecile atricapillus]
MINYSRARVRTIAKPCIEYAASCSCQNKQDFKLITRLRDGCWGFGSWFGLFFFCKKASVTSGRYSLRLCPSSVSWCLEKDTDPHLPTSTFEEVVESEESLKQRSHQLRLAKAMSASSCRCLRAPSAGPARPGPAPAPPACRGLQRHGLSPARPDRCRERGVIPGRGPRNSAGQNAASQAARQPCLGTERLASLPFSCAPAAARKNCLADEAESYRQPNGQCFCHPQSGIPPYLTERKS